MKQGLQVNLGTVSDHFFAVIELCIPELCHPFSMPHQMQNVSVTLELHAAALQWRTKPGTQRIPFRCPCGLQNRAEVILLIRRLAVGSAYRSPIHWGKKWLSPIQQNNAKSKGRSSELKVLLASRKAATVRSSGSIIRNKTKRAHRLWEVDHPGPNPNWLGRKMSGRRILNVRSLPAFSYLYYGQWSIWITQIRLFIRF